MNKSDTEVEFDILFIASAINGAIDKTSILLFFVNFFELSIVSVIKSFFIYKIVKKAKIRFIVHENFLFQHWQIKIKDIIKSMMPGGSVIGCPKIRTLELLNNQEKEDRNIFTGSFGFIKFNRICGEEVRLNTSNVWIPLMVDTTCLNCLGNVITMIYDI